ncbi:hypothetical protein G6Z94_11605 [Vibrio aestuarianus]|uniref:hypothetical protein n=1 Tax=Vibrio aestuarianus TaxID=28171 RepID=UPI00159391C7|nr:hypothetical protein [Vibrio aestuarianus]NGZ17984.1 hypothetical protein [Vibrio aestuarianus]
MAVIDDLKTRLAAYQATELRLLSEGQSIKDEDDRERKEASLNQVRAGIESLQLQIKRIENPRRRLRQYRVKV